jgi:hypothetical protein
LAEVLKTNNMAFKMDGPSLYKKPVGPRATPKPFDREKFEEETRVAQGMENVKAELFSDKSTHETVKKNIKNKTKNNMKKDSSFKLKSGNKPSFAKLSGIEKSPAKNLGDDKKKKEKPDRRQVMNKLYKECQAGDRMACITLKYMQGQKLTQEEKDFANKKKKGETK